MNANKRCRTFRRPRLVLEATAGRRRELHSFPAASRPIQERTKWRGGGGERTEATMQGPFSLHQITRLSKHVRGRGPDWAAQHRHSLLRRTAPNLRAAGAKAQPFRSEGANLHHGARRSVREPQFQFFGRFRACGEGTAGRQCPKAPPSQLREHQEARRHSETFSRATTELRSRRGELQKDSSELQGTLPPPQRRSDRRRRGWLGPRSTPHRRRYWWTQLPSRACLQPCTHSVQQGRGGLASFFLVALPLRLPRAAARSARMRSTRLLGVLSFNPTSGAPPFRFSLSLSLSLSLPCALNKLSRPAAATCFW